VINRGFSAGELLFFFISAIGTILNLSTVHVSNSESDSMSDKVHSKVKFLNDSVVYHHCSWMDVGCIELVLTFRCVFSVDFSMKI